MNLFKPVTLRWWQVGSFKISMIAVGIAIGATWPSIFAIFGGGGLIESFHSLEEQRNNFQATVDAGQKRNLEVRHIEVKVYGNAAVLTGYLTGTNTAPDGTVNQLRQQRTGVWIKQGGQWKVVHRHGSPLLSQ